MQLLGEERLGELLTATRGLDAVTIAGRVENAAMDSQSGKPADDLAVLVLRATGDS